MTIAEAIAILEAAGAVFESQGEEIVIDCPDNEGGEALATSIAFLHEHKAEVASLLRSRSNKQRKGVSLARVAEILGATVVPEGQAPAGWTPEQWGAQQASSLGEGSVAKVARLDRAAATIREAITRRAQAGEPPMRRSEAEHFLVKECGLSSEEARLLVIVRSGSAWAIKLDGKRVQRLLPLQEEPGGHPSAPSELTETEGSGPLQAPEKQEDLKFEDGDGHSILSGGKAAPDTNDEEDIRL